MEGWNWTKKKTFLLIVCALAAVLVIVAAVAVASSPEEKKTEPAAPGQQSSGEMVIPDDELLVDDLYEGKTLIPKFDLPRNQYDLKKFLEKDGVIRYGDFRARLGVDVSEYQGEIDWEKVSEAGVDFAILRLGYRGMTQGLLNVDEAFERNFEEAGNAGLSLGVYFFSQAVTKAEAEAEAQFVADTLAGRKLTYPVFFDWEMPTPTDKLSADQLRAHGVKGSEATEFALAFCRKMKELGYTPAMYTNKYMAYHFFDLEKLKAYDLWYAEYQKAPSLYYNFRLWQYTETGTVAGIDGGVDINICFSSY